MNDWKIKYIDPVAAGEAMFEWVVMTQPHHTKPPDAEQIAEDGDLVQKRYMTRAELLRLFPPAPPPEAAQ